MAQYAVIILDVDFTRSDLDFSIPCITNDIDEAKKVMADVIDKYKKYQGDSYSEIYESEEGCILIKPRSSWCKIEIFIQKVEDGYCFDKVRTRGCFDYRDYL